MPLLPIVERELRVASRRPSTYTMRCLAGLTMMVLWLVLLVGANVSFPARLGQHLFNALGILALGFSMFAGVFLTSDCLSEEKREGTLGLLFLTDLKGYDVVLGKLAATSLHAFFWLVAVFPILGLPLLMGGVSGAEFGRMVLVLSATLFLSLALGMLVSSISYEAKHSTTAGLLLMVLIAGILPALWWLQFILVKAPIFDPLLLPSPAFAYLKLFDATYRLRNGPTDFWRSLFTILGLALSFIVLANLILPRVWQAGGQKVFARTRSKFFPNKLLRTEKESARSFPLRGNPFYWLATRDPSPGAVAKAVLRSSLIVWLILLFAAVFSAKHEEAFITCIFVSYGMHLLLKTLIAMEATRRMNEDRQSGALELLLVTPLPVRDIISGHRAALTTRFKIPIAVVCVANLAMAAIVLGCAKALDMSSKEQVIFTGIFISGILMLLLDFQTLGWVGMWTGLTTKRHHRAVLGAMARVMGPSWVAVFLLIFLERGGSENQVGFIIACWFALGAIVDIAFSANARKKIERTLRSGPS